MLNSVDRQTGMGDIKSRMDSDAMSQAFFQRKSIRLDKFVGDKKSPSSRCSEDEPGEPAEDARRSHRFIVKKRAYVSKVGQVTYDLKDRFQAAKSRDKTNNISLSPHNAGVFNAVGTQFLGMYAKELRSNKLQLRSPPPNGTAAPMFPRRPDKAKYNRYEKSEDRDVYAKSTDMTRVRYAGHKQGKLVQAFLKPMIDY